MNPESYINKLESLRGKQVTLFVNSAPSVRVGGLLHGGELPKQPYSVGCSGSDGSAEAAFQPEDITSLQILPHQTIIDIK
jgi:hypothetical protein